MATSPFAPHVIARSNAAILLYLSAPITLIAYAERGFT